ncbi:MAG: Type 1 glutamine amidotransferase-like domain-containing protein, partial [Anaerolineales bacterium]
MTRRLLLLSNSTNHGRGYLDHAIETVRAFFRPVERLVFVPFALHDREGYTAKARERFAREGIQLEALRADESGRRLLADASGVFVGGGNTFRLLDLLQRSGALDVLRRRARAGMPYLG